MELHIVGRHIEITDRFRNHVDSKIIKISQFDAKAQDLHVTVNRHHAGKGLIGSDRVEITLVCPGHTYRAESDGEDKYGAFDLAFGHLIDQMRKNKDKQKIHRGGAHRPLSVHEASAHAFSEVDIEPASAEAIERVSTGSTRTVGPVDRAS
jgi:ribosomal subunit interface protein